MQPPTAIRPRRSLLYVPGSNARAIEKARTIAVDAIILDLEDSVAPAAKDAARDQAVAAVKAGGFGGREVVVRVNGPDTSWGAADLEAVATAGPDAVLVPKVSEPASLHWAMEGLGGAATRTRIWAMIETPAALLAAPTIAAASRDPALRFSALVLGTNDLAKETRTRIVPGRWTMIPWLAGMIAVARAHGLDIFDGVFTDLHDEAGLRAECEQGRDLGFDGKTLIHPNQIEAANAVFGPSADDVDEARSILAAFDRPENRDVGVIALHGRMVERLHADMARRTLALADAIGTARRP